MSGGCLLGGGSRGTLIDGSVLYSAKESQLDYAQACGWGLRAAGSQGPDQCL